MLARAEAGAVEWWVARAGAAELARQKYSQNDYNQKR
jgi:hypothetical protein